MGENIPDIIIKEAHLCRVDLEGSLAEVLVEGLDEIVLAGFQRILKGI